MTRGDRVREAPRGDPVVLPTMDRRFWSRQGVWLWAYRLVLRALGQMAGQGHRRQVRIGAHNSTLSGRIFS
jgi:hypothetical protein